MRRQQDGTQKHKASGGWKPDAWEWEPHCDSNHVGFSMPILQDSESFENLMDTLRMYRTMGCDIVRFSYPDLRDHEVFARICAHSPMPVVADIHFDWRLAMDALTCGAHKIRINPGNIGARWKVDEVVSCAKDHGAAIRIGLNGGSLPLHLREQDHVQGMVATALTYIEWFEAWIFIR